ncbi:hypothetical protein GQ600_18673 [Phytophthora cactorum]|nr:hypothetical protein GQ600_18673 [Phytophthora cactorum]
MNNQEQLGAQVQQPQDAVTCLVDPLLIAKENNVHEVSKLTELLLGCAVQCPNKSEYIHPIMQMAADKYSALESEARQLRSERQNTLTRDNKKIQQIVDNEVHALQMQMEEKDLELNRVKRESGERLMMLENEVRRQPMSLIFTLQAGELNKLEASVTKYKKKLEEMNSLRAQSTIKTMPGLKNLVEKYKNQVVRTGDSQRKASSNLRQEQKIRRLQEELDSALVARSSSSLKWRSCARKSQDAIREGTDDAMAAGESSAVNGGGLSADMCSVATLLVA